MSFAPPPPTQTHALPDDFRASRPLPLVPSLVLQTVFNFHKGFLSVNFR